MTAGEFRTRYEAGLSLPVYSFTGDVLGKDGLARRLSEGDEDEVGALLSNPTVDGEILIALYKNEGLFASLPDEGRTAASMRAVVNPPRAASTVCLNPRSAARRSEPAMVSYPLPA